MDLIEALQAEAQFWDEMISQQLDCAEPETIERMRMAKLLAEQKQQLYTAKCDEAPH